jgi:hypothetical protein
MVVINVSCSVRTYAVHTSAMRSHRATPLNESDSGLELVLGVLQVVEDLLGQKPPTQVSWRIDGSGGVRQ